jgi:hypothetical protein
MNPSKSYTAPTVDNHRINPNDASAVPFLTNAEKARAFRRLSRIFATAAKVERQASNLAARAAMLSNQASTSAGILAERTRNGRNY